MRHERIVFGVDLVAFCGGFGGADTMRFTTGGFKGNSPFRRADWHAIPLHLVYFLLRARRRARTDVFRAPARIMRAVVRPRV